MIETPFMTGKQYRDDELGEMAVRMANQRLYALISHGITLLVLLLLFFTVTLPKRVLQVVEVDRSSGDVRLATTPWDQYAPLPASYTSQLRRDLDALRKVTMDKEDMRKQHAEARVRMTDQGKQQYAAWLKERKPFEQKDPTTIEFLGPPLHGEGLTWEVRWRETTYGHQLKPETWRGRFTFIRAVPKTEDERIATPLGLFLDTWSWGRE